MIQKFDTKKYKKQLRKVNKENNKPIDAGIILIINNMEVYNQLVENIDPTNSKAAYLIYQLSATIFNQLRDFQIFPDKKKDKDVDNDQFTNLINKLNQK